MDLDASGEFMFGPDLLVAQNPSPEEIAPYEVYLPPGVWYDYWTGERFEHRSAIRGEDSEKTRGVTAPQAPDGNPDPFGAACLFSRRKYYPVAPQTENSDVAPNGPLTLRIYPNGTPEKMSHSS